MSSSLLLPYKSEHAIAGLPLGVLYTRPDEGSSPVSRRQSPSTLAMAEHMTQSPEEDYEISHSPRRLLDAFRAASPIRSPAARRPSLTTHHSSQSSVSTGSNDNPLLAPSPTISPSGSLFDSLLRSPTKLPRKRRSSSVSNVNSAAPSRPATPSRLRVNTQLAEAETERPSEPSQSNGRPALIDMTAFTIFRDAPAVGPSSPTTGPASEADTEVYADENTTPEDKENTFSPPLSTILLENRRPSPLGLPDSVTPPATTIGFDLTSMNAPTEVNENVQEERASKRQRAS